MNSIRNKVDKIVKRFSQVPPPVVMQPIPQPEQPITGDPFLPPELERYIFELVAANDTVGSSWSQQHVGDTVLVLPRVCRRVQCWIEPMIYSRIPLMQPVMDGDRAAKFLATIDARPACFFATHVRVLYIGRRIALSAVQRILSVCTGVVDFACHYSYLSLSHLLAPLPLQRLCLSEFAPPSTPLPPWAASLTHLGLTEKIPADPANAFAALPALTHLAVGYEALPKQGEPGFGAALTRLFTACGSKLQVFVLMTGAKTDSRWAYQRLREDAFADPRLYVHLRPIADATWDAWSRHVPDVFERAEVEVVRRIEQAHAKTTIS
ncbi:Zn(2)-C6 fungal-type domain-containing protein [Favolaschia claudopus]|uniref:Zn(2)-C6 fungal-type domain-containing protein n=1 Tax=Favolaschia claudopus TaxID=2862362 RepID=A0AAW0B825_9AGAR